MRLVQIADILVTSWRVQEAKVFVPSQGLAVMELACSEVSRSSELAGACGAWSHLMSMLDGSGSPAAKVWAA